MDFISVDKTKLKVILSPDDVESLALCSDAFDADTDYAKDVFKSIMRRAQSEAGFSAENGKLFVRCFPSKDGGCELFITKLSDEDFAVEAMRKRRKTKYFLFRTDSLSTLACACSYLESGGYGYLSSVYHGDETGYCLMLTLPPRPSYTTGRICENFLSRLREFGEFTKLSNEKTLYICEHCKLLCERNAVKVFSMFSK